MIGVPITVRNHENGASVILNDHITDDQNVIALQVFPTFQTELRSQNIPRSGSHGEYRMPSYYGGMPIVLSGVIVGLDEDSVWQMKALLDQVFSLGKAGFSKVSPASDIDPAIAMNQCLNPRGKVSTAGWDGLDASLANELGSPSITVTTEADSEAGLEYVDSEVVQVAGDRVCVALDVTNASDGTRTFRLGLQGLDSEENEVSGVSEDIELASGATGRVFCQIPTIGANVTDIRVSVLRLEADAEDDDVFSIDRVLLIVNPPANIDPETDYFDGSSNSGSLLRYAWQGATDLSRSEVYKQRLASFAQNNVRLSFTRPDGIKVFIDASPVQSISYDRPLQQKFLLNWQVIVRSNYPYLIVDEDFPPFERGLFGSYNKGLSIPTEVPFSFNQEFIKNPIVINSTRESFAILRMFGSASRAIVNPKITNITNGQFVKINRSLLGAGRYFVIDGLYQTMLDENGVDVSPYSEGDFIMLEQGENVLVYSSD